MRDKIASLNVISVVLIVEGRIRANEIDTTCIMTVSHLYFRSYHVVNRQENVAPFNQEKERYLTLEAEMTKRKIKI